MGTGVAGFGTYAHFGELNEPLDTQEGVLSPTVRKQRCLANLGLAGLNGAAVTALTDSSGGTPSDTIAAVTAGGSYAQADIVALKNAVASLTAKVNALIARTAVS